MVFLPGDKVENNTKWSSQELATDISAGFGVLLEFFGHVGLVC